MPTDRPETTLCTPENECSDPGSRYCRCYRGAGHREAERIAKAAQQTTESFRRGDRVRVRGQGSTVYTIREVLQEYPGAPLIARFMEGGFWRASELEREQANGR